MNAAPLFRWYKKEKRDLPWRKTHDPYRILVSEIMLQQTQVSRVLDFYKRWLKKFPTWGSLARASNAEIVHAWSGLGYNRRGLMLRDIARQIVAHGVPKTEQEWLELKGIGPYTAAAISAFAQGKKTVPIDTNIRRVLGRILLAKPFPDLKDDQKLKRLIGPRPPEFWQATFDLAVAICKKNPDCAVCPMRNQCPASKKFLSGRIKIPKRMIKKAIERKHRDKPFPDRIYRGRILKLARVGITLKELGTNIDPDFNTKRDTAWLMAMVSRLEKDGLVRRSGKSLLV
jgi:A/G-specific adenine glycosylase